MKLRFVVQRAHRRAKCGRALGVVVLDVLPKQASQVPFAEHDHVIEKLPPNAADEALRRPVLPRASEGCALEIDSEPFDCPGD
jgi:hypothetical protein